MPYSVKDNMNNTCYKTDALHVFWSLLYTCNYKCSYCNKQRIQNNYILEKDKIIRILNNIIKIPHTDYYINICGGEATLHPWLDDMIQYLISLPRNIKIDISTNGSMAPSRYLNLARYAPHNELGFTINVHPDYADLTHILTLVGALGERGYSIKVRLAARAKLSEKYALFYKILTQFQDNVPFSLMTGECQDPVSFGANDVIADKFCSNTSSDMPGDTGVRPVEILSEFISPSDVLLKRAEDPPCYKNFYCCTGINILRIEPDGSYYGSLCDFSPCNPPLWQENIDSITRTLPEIIKCGRERCVYKMDHVLPKFRQYEDAQRWIKSENENRAKLAWALMPLPDAGAISPSIENIVHVKLLWLAQKTQRQPDAPQPVQEILFLEVEDETSGIGEISAISSKPPSIQNFARDNFQAICEVYQFIKDGRSKDNYLKLINAFEFGVNPALIGNEESGKPGNLPEFDANGAWQKDMENRFLCQGGFRVALHDNAAACLAIPLYIQEFYPEFSLFIDPGLNKDEIGAVFVAYPPFKTKMPFVRDEADMPLISAIVIAGDNKEDLRRSLDSILAQTLRQFEIIIVGCVNNEDIRGVIEEYVCNFSQFIRCLGPSCMDMTADMLNMAIKIALGRYIVFVSARGFITGDIFTSVKSAVFNHDYDIITTHKLDINTKKEGAGAVYINDSYNNPYGYFYKRQYLNNNNFQFAKINNFDDIIFYIYTTSSCANMKNLAEVGYINYNKEEYIDESLFIDFCKFVLFLEYNLNNINLDVNQIKELLIELYGLYKSKLYSSLQYAYRQNILDNDLLNNDSAIYSLPPFIINELLKDYASIFISMNNIAIPFWVEDSSLKTRPPHSPEGEESVFCHNNENMGNVLLSIILSIDKNNKGIEGTLKSILAQSIQSFEIILVIGLAGEDLADSLRVYGAMDRRVRVCECGSASSVAELLNLGIELSKGRYIAFAESGEIFNRDFLETGSMAMQTGAGMAAFSRKTLTSEGKLIEAVVFEDKTMSRLEAAIGILDGTFDSRPWGKIMDAEIIRKTGLKFSISPGHPLDKLVWQLLNHCPCIQTSSLDASERVLEAEVSNTTDYEPILSTCARFDFYEKIYSSLRHVRMPRVVSRSLCKRGVEIFEKGFLADLLSFWQARGKMPNPLHELSINKNRFFLRSLIQGYASLQGVFPEVDDCIISQYEFPPTDNPVLTVVLYAHNAERDLAGSIKCLESQSLKNIEILVVDDCSHDMTADYCAGLQDGRFSLIKTRKHLGRGACENMALRQAKGKHVLFMGAGTVFGPDMLLRGIMLLASFPGIDLVHFREKRELDYLPDIFPLFLDGTEAFAAWCGGRFHGNIEDGTLFRKEFVQSRENLNFNAPQFSLALQLLASSRKIAIACEKECTVNEKSIYEPEQSYKRALFENFQAMIEAEEFFSREKGARCHELNKIAWEKILVEDFRQNMAMAAIHFDQPDMGFDNEFFDAIAVCHTFLKFLLADYGAICMRLGDKIRPVLLQESQAHGELIPMRGKELFPGAPTVSIIIRIGDCGDALVESIKGILNQSPDNIEILLIADCSSSGNSISLCFRLAMEERGVRLFRTTTRISFSQAIMRAIPFCRGEYVAFLNSGDRLSPNCIQRSISFAKDKSRFPLILFSWSEYSPQINGVIRRHSLPDKITLESAGLLDFFTRNNFEYLSLCGKFIKRSLLNSIFEDNDANNSLEIYLTLKIIDKVDEAICSEINLYEKTAGNSTYFDFTTESLEKMVTNIRQLDNLLIDDYLLNPAESLFQKILYTIINRIDFDQFAISFAKTDQFEMDLDKANGFLKLVTDNTMIFRHFLSSYGRKCAKEISAR